MNIAIPNGNGEFHLLTNERLAVGDQVFPMVHGYKKNGKFYLLDFNPTSYTPETLLAVTGWPSSPHTIKGFYLQDGLEHIRTDKGYGPAESYFRIMA